MEKFLNILEDAEKILSAHGGHIFLLLLMLPFLLIALVLVPIFMIKGYKKGTYRALTALGCSVAACGVSVLFSRLISGFAAKLIFNKFSGFINRLTANFIGNTENSSVSLKYVPQFAEGLLGALLSIIVFLLVFIILLIVVREVIGRLLKPFLSKKGAPKWFNHCGMYIALLDALLVSFLLFAPFYTVIGQSADTIDGIVGGLSETENENGASRDAGKEAARINEKLSKLLKLIKNCPTVWLAQKPVFDFGKSAFGLFVCDGRFYNVYDVAKDSSDIAVQLFSLIQKSPESIGNDEVETLRNLLKKADKDKFLYGVISDALSLANGILEREEGNASAAVKIVGEIVGSFSECKINDLEECAESVVSVFDIAVRHEVFRYFKKPDKLVSVAANQNFISETVYALRGSQILSSAMDNILLYSLDIMDFSNNPSNKEKYEECVEIVRASIRESIQKGEPEKESEVRAYTYLMFGLNGVYRTTNGLKSFRLDTVDAEGLAGMLIGLGIHPYVGEESLRRLVNTVLPMLDEQEGNIFTESFLDDAVNSLLYDVNHPPVLGAAGKFSNLLASSRDSVSIVSKMSDAVNEADKAEIEDLIGKLIEDMTTDSSNAISNAITPELIEKYAGSQRSSEELSNLLSSVFKNMSDVDVSDKMKAKIEKKGITEMGVLVLNASKDIGNRSLEEILDGDMKGFLESVSSSEVVMKSIEQTTKNEKSDPTQLFKKMTEQDKNDLKNACRDLISEDPSKKENLRLICLFMGVEL